MRLPDPIGIYALLDAGTLPAAELPGAARELAAGGIRVFQVRAKDLPAGPLLGLVRQVRESLPPACVLLVNDRADVARLAGVDGVHVGDEDLPVPAAREFLGGGIVGYSTHSPAEAAAARSLQPDYIGFGPVYESRTKQTGRVLLGPDGVREACRATSLPVVAIGGIDLGRVAEVRRAGASGVAMIAALLVPGRYRELAARAVETFSTTLPEGR